MKKNDLSWYAVYTKPFLEKKVAHQLEQAEILSYCPLQRVQRQWSDRKKTLYTPIFKSYVFLKIAESQKTLVRRISGVVNFVHYLGKPAVIRDQEIEAIKKFHTDHEHIEVRKAEPGMNGHSTFSGHASSSVQKSFVELIHKTAELYLPAFGCILSAGVSKPELLKDSPQSPGRHPRTV